MEEDDHSQGAARSFLPGHDIEMNGNGKILENPPEAPRKTWSRGIEFLFSCIAMSVGLGNLWRFPHIAVKNGGGAFVIPYLIVLFLIGKPGYFLEMTMGTFSSRGTIKVYDCVPAMRGVGTGQVLASVFVTTYYSSIMGLSLKYVYESIFSSNLPWAHCEPEWGNCYNATETTIGIGNITGVMRTTSSAIYFGNIHNATDSLANGTGYMNWNLVGFLAVSWGFVFFTLIKGIKSSGKVSYVLAILPYLLLTVILVKSLQLPGAIDGIKVFFTPKWEKMLDPKVWYDAVTQVFFSLNVYFANVIMYSSYNDFRHNIYRDANIVTTLDTFTSLLAGCCVFAVLGNVAKIRGVEDIVSVSGGGPGVAFIAYPEAIAKLGPSAKIFSIIFFLMLYTLGMGSNVAMASCLMTELKDHFKKIKTWQAALFVAIFGTCGGSIYYFQNGIQILSFVDYYASTFVAFNLVIFELITFCYIYGVDRICKDIKFMSGFYPGYYWRICWKYLTPSCILGLLLFFYIKFDEVKKEELGSTVQPPWVYNLGCFLAALSLCHLPLIAIYKIYTSEGSSWKKKIIKAFKPTKNWGPRNEKLRLEYYDFLRNHDDGPIQGDRKGWLGKYI